MKRVKNLMAIAAFSLLILCLPAIASAQNGNPNDPYGRNGGYNNGGNNNGQYGNYGNYGDMRSVVRDLKNRSRELQKHLDRDLDNSRYNGSRREDDLNDLARRFKNEVNGLSESNNNYGRYGRRDNRVERVLDLGAQLDRALSRSRLDYHIQELVQGIRYDLDALRNSYGYDNGGYNNNRNGNGGWNNGRRPSWWPF